MNIFDGFFTSANYDVLPVAQIDIFVGDFGKKNLLKPSVSVLPKGNMKAKSVPQTQKPGASLMRDSKK